MAASTAHWSVVDVESFIHEYYDAWSGTDEDRIMSYYSENVEDPAKLLGPVVLVRFLIHRAQR